MTPEQKIAITEISAAIKNLVLAANTYNCAVVGFVFGADPSLIVRFGNTIEKGPELAELYLRLNDVAEEKESAGLVIKNPIDPNGDIHESN